MISRRKGGKRHFTSTLTHRAPQTLVRVQKNARKRAAVEATTHVRRRTLPSRLRKEEQGRIPRTSRTREQARRRRAGKGKQSRRKKKQSRISSVSSSRSETRPRNHGILQRWATARAERATAASLLQRKVVRTHGTTTRDKGPRHQIASGTRPPRVCCAPRPASLWRVGRTQP